MGAGEWLPGDFYPLAILIVFEQRQRVRWLVVSPEQPDTGELLGQPLPLSIDEGVTEAAIYLSDSCQ